MVDECTGKKLIFRSIVLTKVDILEHPPPFRGTKSFGIIKTQEVFGHPQYDVYWLGYIKSGSFMP